MAQHVLKSCKHQCYQTKEDRLSELPDDLLLRIMSLLTMKQAARTSVLSHKWNHLWKCYPVLIFKNPIMMDGMDRNDEDAIIEERASFVWWVNQVMESHIGCTVDELSVSFYFDSSDQIHIDKWVVFALAKQVKKLELDFTPLPCFKRNYYLPPRWSSSPYQPHNVSAFKSCLRSLHLRYVDIIAEDVDCLLRTCMVLEDLCIEFAQFLSDVRACDSPLQLKHLKVFACSRLRTIDILAPNLLSFKHTGKPIELHLRNASSLLKVAVGSIEHHEDVVAYAFDSLSKYFSQLESLSWNIRLSNPGAAAVEFNLGINKPPAMSNLKHLKLELNGKSNQSLLGWADLIEASPLLQRLTVFILLIDSSILRRSIVKRNKCSLKSLRKLHLCGDIGYPIDLEFATFVIENSIMLKEVVLDFWPRQHYMYSRSKQMTYVQNHVAEIKRIVPQGCKVRVLYEKSRERYLERFP